MSPPFNLTPARSGSRRERLGSSDIGRERGREREREPRSRRVDDSKYCFLSPLFVSFHFSFFFSPLSFLRCVNSVLFGRNRDEATGTDTEGRQAGAELGWVCGSDRWTRTDKRLDRRTGGQAERTVDIRNSLLEDTGRLLSCYPPSRSRRVCGWPFCQSRAAGLGTL